MKILYIITRLDQIGGAQIHVRDLANKLSDNGHDVIVAFGGLASTAFIDTFTGDNIHLERIPSLKRNFGLYNDFRALCYVVHLINYYQPDLISCHSSKSGLIGRIAAFLTCYINKTIFTAHGWAFATGIPSHLRIIYAAIENILQLLCANVVTVCKTDLILAKKFIMHGHDKFHCIHNGMPSSACLSKWITDPAYEPSNGLNFITVARFEHQKDHHLLFDALSHLPDGLNWKLTLVGDGSLENYYKNYAIDIGIDQNLEFLGYCRNVDTILAQMDIYLLVSRWEGFPRSILEAMRSGLPVIASNVGGVSESVIDHYNGRLLEPGSLSSLLGALNDFIYSNPSDLRSYAVNSRSFYEKEFSFDAMYTKYFGLYASTISNSN